MDVGVIGAGLPGLIVARALADRGNNVVVYGPRECGSLSPLGPRHLWANPETEQLGETFVVRVAWIEGRRIAREPKTASLDGLSSKTGKAYSRDHLPCRGVSSFTAVRDGMKKLLDSLDVDDLVRVEQFVTSLPGGGMVEVDSLDHAAVYRHLVTTLPPQGFFRLWPLGAQYKVPKAKPVYFTLTAEPPHPHAMRDTLYYCGDLAVPWYRASWVGDSWCYESRKRVTEFDTEARTQVVGKLSVTYPPWTTPVGRYAEWEGELMVSDVYERRHWYAERVEELL